MEVSAIVTFCFCRSYAGKPPQQGSQHYRLVFRHYFRQVLRQQQKNNLK